MRNILQKFIFGMAITAAVALAADNSLGTWKLNMEKSKFTPSAPVKSLTSTREASEDGVKVTSTGERADGTPINGSYQRQTSMEPRSFDRGNQFIRKKDSGRRLASMEP